MTSKNIWWWSSFGKYICIFKTCGFVQLWGYFASSFILYLKLIWFWFYLIYYFFNIFSPLWRFTAIEILKWVIISFLLVSLLKCYSFIITVYLFKCVASNNWHLWRNKLTHTKTCLASHCFRKHVALKLILFFWSFRSKKNNVIETKIISHSENTFNVR